MNKRIRKKKMKQNGYKYIGKTFTGIQIWFVPDSNPDFSHHD